MISDGFLQWIERRNGKTVRVSKKAWKELNKRTADLERSLQNQQVLELVNRNYVDGEIQVEISYESSEIQ